MKKIVFDIGGETCEVVHPTPEFIEAFTAYYNGISETEPSDSEIETAILDYVINYDVPVGANYRCITDDKIPSSRNYRDAWTDKNDTETIDVDLEKAKPIHKIIMVVKAFERVEKNDFDEQDFTVVKAEIEAIDFGSINNLDDLYNTFPASIDNRKERRVYKSHA